MEKQEFYNHNRLPRRLAPRNDQKRSYANLSCENDSKIGRKTNIGL